MLITTDNRNMFKKKCIYLNNSKFMIKYKMYNITLYTYNLHYFPLSYSSGIIPLFYIICIIHNVSMSLLLKFNYNLLFIRFNIINRDKKL